MNENTMSLVSTFTRDSKLQGQSILQLQPAPAAPVAPDPWPFVWQTPGYNQAIELISVQTVNNVPQVMTISLGAIGSGEFTPVGGAPTPTEVVAILELGIGGIAYRVEMDFMNGVQFSVAANRLKLNALYRVLPGWPGAIPTPPPTYNAGAALGIGVVAHGRQPQRTLTHQGTVGVPALAIGALERWGIPPFSKSFKVVAIPNNSTLQIDPYNNFIPSADYALLAYPTVDLPLPNDSRNLLVTNTSIIANVTGYRIIFDLAL